MGLTVQTVYLWNAATGNISELCSTQEGDDDYNSSVSWLDDGVHVAVGTASAQVQIWDASQQRKIRTMQGHRARVAALSWNEHVLSSGSKTGAIFNSDVRVQNHQIATLEGHTQEVCGLRWSPDGKSLARYDIFFNLNCVDYSILNSIICISIDL
jgi:cell division cycle protein 20 (cofactor of APC complex)